MSKKSKRDINISGGVYNEGENHGIQVGGNINFDSSKPDYKRESSDQDQMISDYGYENQKLRHLLVTYFNESELRDLCFDLGIDYDTLSGSSKSDHARELIAYVLRRGQFERFMELLQQHRPNLFV